MKADHRLRTRPGMPCSTFADETRSAWFNRVSGSVFFLLGLGMLRLKAGRA